MLLASHKNREALLAYMFKLTHETCLSMKFDYTLHCSFGKQTVKKYYMSEN